MPLPEQQASPPIDPDIWDALLGLWADDGPAEVIELIHDFLSDSEVHIATIRAAFAECDPVRLERAAHTLKSSCANMGATRLSKFCKDFQDAGHKGDVTAAAPLLEPFLQAAAEAHQALEQESFRLSAKS